MAQEYGIFLVGFDLDYKPDTGEFVANVTVQVEALGVSKRIRRQVASVTLGQVYTAIQALLGNIAIIKGIPYPTWAGEAPPSYVPTHTGAVVVVPNLSGGVPEDMIALPAPDYDMSIYGPPEEEP